ncbi:transglycosylase family protein [Streptomyces sp. NPDC026665]|uniref:transglycosylase family protein n=1 Tax=Streptomyces sp. NPDC026665 TaxID=3154798 RepID=UPI0033C2F8E8
MTGSAIAIPLLAAASASAADGTTWDRVAQCESGGAWSSSDGNGYYGGLQLDQDNWEAHGGLDYAPTADQASRSQQIAVAEKVLADSGLKAWPTCGPLSGLSKDSAGIGVDTGVAGDSSSTGDDSDSYISSGLATSPSSSPSGDSSGSGDSSNAGGDAATPSASQSSDGSGTATDKSDKSAKSGKKDASSTPSDASTGGTGRHRGGDAAESAADAGADASTGRHAASPAAETADPAYVADAIDNLWSVSDALGLESGWGDLPKVDTGADSGGPGLVIPGRSIVDTAETVQK